MSTVGYVKDLCSFKLKINYVNNAKNVADYCNKLAVDVKKIAIEHESLLHILPQGSPVEKF